MKSRSLIIGSIFAIAVTVLLSYLQPSSGTTTAPKDPLNKWSDAGLCGVAFSIPETLMLPMKTGASLTMTPIQDAVLFVEYGPQSGAYTHTTMQSEVAGGTPAKFLLGGLEPDRQYYYRVECKPAGQKTFRPRQEYSFKTLRSENQVFSFAYATDAHIYQSWSQLMGGLGTKTPIDYFNATMGNLKNSGADFLIIGGDFVHTHCQNSCPAFVENGIQYAAGTVQTPEQADLRYMKVFSKGFFGQITNTLPFIYVLGNHDGEAGFGDANGTCGQYSNTRELSQNARLKYFVNPNGIYGGDREGGYYSFETGDALIVVIDVMRYTKVYPQTANDWTLGSEQLAWLENTLKNSQKKWKFIFAEHLDGGETLTSNCYYYGRGGLRATDNDLPSGAYKGEQEKIHQLMKSYGAQFFVNSHDHVAVIGEKQDENGVGEGIYQIAGGQMADDPPKWATDKTFEHEMDWDLDGAADYYSDTNGTIKRGYYKITVNGKNSVTFDYIRSDFQDPTVNGTVVFNKTIYSR